MVGFCSEHSSFFPIDNVYVVVFEIIQPYHQSYHHKSNRILCVREKGCNRISALEVVNSRKKKRFLESLNVALTP